MQSNYKKKTLPEMCLICGSMSFGLKWLEWKNSELEVIGIAACGKCYYKKVKELNLAKRI